MNTDQNFSDDELARYLSGEATPAECATIDAWMASAPEHRSAVERLADGWDVARHDRAEPDVEAALAVFHRNRLAAPRRSWNVPSETRAPVRGRALTKGIAAVAAMGACVIAAVALVRPAEPTHAAARTYRTAVAQRATLMLSDGSRVVLAPGTTLRVSEGFGTKVRTVSVDGQALFDVKSQHSAPLVVQTCGAQVRVLGTTFSVSQYENDAAAMVVVTSGRVAIGRPGSPATTTLSAGEIGRVDSTVTVSRGDDATRYTEWARGRFVFDDTPLPNVLNALERWYGVRFTLASQDSADLAARKVTVSFDERSLADAIGTLKVLMQLDAAYEGKTIVISRGGKNSSGARKRALPSRKPLFTSEVGR